MSDFFEDNKGHKSSMRLMCFISLMTAVALGCLIVVFEKDIGVEITMAFLAGAFAPKAVQKYTETKI